MQSPSKKSQRISHTRNRSLSFQSFHFPSDRQFPLYAHCNSQHRRSTPRIRCNTQCTPRSRHRDLMRTVDHRIPVNEKRRRSSFALSDIFERDEEEVEVEISPVLPSTPSSACSVSTSDSAKSLVKSALSDLAHTVKTKWGRVRSRRMYVVEPAGRSVKVDLLHM
ncbi:hypothetical protein K466DRAFT_659813 [Polyporus arcularius HHB13444]|uniref:Uncharacterized protein n=1 Tax=Polyporus arcularius HHB13444 TaxID=1314778 RepID=A0A5C3PQQ2_9APHY|nr:hypothetical protein K466DRAFT_659813 [Polyporus arcularius HHB13444]